MTNESTVTEFAPKTWIFTVQALIFGCLGIFSLIFGPLFLFQIVLDARGKPAPDAGIALLIMSIPFLCLFALATFNILARRQPLIRLFQEGVVARQIGSSSLDGIPFIPAQIRIAWLFISLQGFKQNNLMIPWETLRNSLISGAPMNRTLTLNGTVYGLANRSNPHSDKIANQLVFPEVAFVTPLHQIADTIYYYHQNVDVRGNLRGWNE